MKKTFYFFSLITIFMSSVANAQCLISFSVRQICSFHSSGTDPWCQVSSEIALKRTDGAYFCSPTTNFSGCELTPTHWGLECGWIYQQSPCNNVFYCQWKSNDN